MSLPNFSGNSVSSANNTNNSANVRPESASSSSRTAATAVGAVTNRADESSPRATIQSGDTAARNQSNLISVPSSSGGEGIGLTTAAKHKNAASRFNAAASKVAAMARQKKHPQPQIVPPLDTDHSKLDDASPLEGRRRSGGGAGGNPARRPTSAGSRPSSAGNDSATTEDHDPSAFGAQTSDSFGNIQPLASGTFEQKASRRRSRIDSAASLGGLEKEDTFLGSSSGGALTLRKIFMDADVEHMDFLTPEQTFAALMVVGVTMKMEEMHEMLDEIDINVITDDDNQLRSSFNRLQLLGTDEEHGGPVDGGELSLSGSLSRRPLNPLHSVAGGDGVIMDHNREDALIDSVAGALAMQRMGLSTSAKKQERRRRRRVLFEDFEKLIELWQSAARFQLFEKRSEETEARLQATMERKYLTTDSAWMWVWQVIMLFAGCYLVMVPVAVFTNTDEEMAQYFALYTPFDAIVTVILLADMILKCCTCVTTQVNGVSVVVDDWRGIIREYVRTPWFWIDLLVLIPWRFAVLAGGDVNYLMTYNSTTHLLTDAASSGCRSCVTLSDYLFAVDVATVLLLLRALKFLEHFRYFEETGLTPLTRNYVQRQYVVGMGLIQGARFVVLVHILSVIYLSLYRYNNEVAAAEAAGGVGAGSNNSSSGLLSSSSGSDPTPSYAEAMYLVLYCMATVGYGDIPPRNDKERAYFMFLIAVGWLFNAYIIGSLVGFFQTSDIETERQSKLLELSTLLEHFEVPPSLTLEILSFEDYLLSNSIKKSFGHVVNDLPQDMQRNLELWNRVKVINSIPFFQVFHKSAKLQICNVLVEITFCPEDYVYMIGEMGTEMFFVNHGFVDILDHNSDWVSTKKAGDSFGEIGAFEMDSRMRSEDAKCLTYCEFFLLSRDSLTEVRQRYPRVQKFVESFCDERREEEMAKLDLAMSVRYHVAETEGGMGMDATSDGPDSPQQQLQGSKRRRSSSKDVLPDGQFALGFDEGEDGFERKNSFASMQEDTGEEVTDGHDARARTTQMSEPGAGEEGPAEGAASAIMTMDDPLCGFRLTQRNSNSGINDGVAGVMLSVSVREMAASLSARAHQQQQQQQRNVNGRPKVTIERDASAPTSPQRTSPQVPAYYQQRQQQPQQQQQQHPLSSSSFQFSPTTVVTSMYDGAAATPAAHHQFAGGAGTGDGPHKTPSDAHLQPPLLLPVDQQQQSQPVDMESFSSPLQAGMQPQHHHQPHHSSSSSPLSPERVAPQNMASPFSPQPHEHQHAPQPHNPSLHYFDEVDDASTTSSTPRGATPRGGGDEGRQHSHHSGSSNASTPHQNQQTSSSSNPRHRSQQQFPTTAAALRTSVAVMVPSLARTLSTGSNSGRGSAGSGGLPLQRDNSQPQLLGGGGGVMGGVAAVLSIAQRKRQQQQQRGSGGGGRQGSGLSVDVNGSGAAAPDDAMMSTRSPHPSVTESGLALGASAASAAMQFRLSPLASGATPAARQARTEAFHRSSSLQSLNGRSPAAGRVVSASSYVGGLTPNTNASLGVPLRSPKQGHPQGLSSVEQRHLLPAARMLLSAARSGSSPLMPGLQTGLTPTAAQGRPTVQFLGDDSALLDDLLPLLGSSSNLDPRSGGEPIPIPSDVNETDWNGVRSEVGRLKHQALVEIVMHCLGGAVDVYDQLNHTQ